MIDATFDKKIRDFIRVIDENADTLKGARKTYPMQVEDIAVGQNYIFREDIRDDVEGLKLKEFTIDKVTETLIQYRFERQNVSSDKPTVLDTMALPALSRDDLQDFNFELVYTNGERQEIYSGKIDKHNAVMILNRNEKNIAIWIYISFDIRDCDTYPRVVTASNKITVFSGHVRTKSDLTKVFNEYGIK